MSEELAVIPGPRSDDGRIESYLRATELDDGRLELAVEVLDLPAREIDRQVGIWDKSAPRTWNKVRLRLVDRLFAMVELRRQQCLLPADFDRRLERDLKPMILPWLSD